ncbi:MAG: hypothetical protein AAGG75_27320 [Bacteroidota bacterium]
MSTTTSSNLSTSAQVTSESISTVDSQIASILATDLPTISVSSINQDFDDTKDVLGRWGTTLKAELTAVMKAVVSCAETLDEEEPAMETLAQSQLTAMVQTYLATVEALSEKLEEVNSDVATFYTDVDACISKINTDTNEINTEIASLNQQVADVNSEIKSQQSKIDYYNKNPWKLILDGLTIVGLIKDLDTLNSTSKNLKKEAAQLNSINAQLASLDAVQEPLAEISPSLSVLSFGLSQLHTSVSEVKNALSELLDTPTVPSLIAAELQSIQAQIDQASTYAQGVLE